MEEDRAQTDIGIAAEIEEREREEELEKLAQKAAVANEADGEQPQQSCSPGPPRNGAETPTSETDFTRDGPHPATVSATEPLSEQEPPAGAEKPALKQPKKRFIGRRAAAEAAAARVAPGVSLEESGAMGM